MNFKSAVLTVCAIALLSACGGGSEGGSSGSTQGLGGNNEYSKMDNTCGESDFDRNALAIINAYRAAGATCGDTYFSPAKPLIWNQSMRNAALVHSLDMAKIGISPGSHTGSDGSDAGTRMQRQGYDASQNYWGEGLGIGYSDISSMLNGQLNSPPHCKNLMSKNYVRVGVSCAASDRKYVTINFH